ncbi:very short patch repair endonuclease [Desulfonatronum parangueonense]
MSSELNPKPRRHRGDIMSPEKRSAVMSRIKGRGTGPEKKMEVAFASKGLSWEEQARDLPGRPDFVFRQEKVAVFVDGDFWHGWRFHQWRDKLTEKWEAKIEATRHRDTKNHRRLRRAGWKVVRLWEHQIKENQAKCLERVLDALGVVNESDLRDSNKIMAKHGATW